ncbi:FecR domain-containing protein [Comamonas sp. GB3 AK4-5]|uniref:FecR domain-containing protein n=1 Tax=Comamonas sp. GB3 AK4-5 TaxID=3231487 RepID=UPI00351EECD2
MHSPTLDPAVIRQAAQWLVRLHAGPVTAQDHAACARWRAAHPAHEQAWQKAERLAHQFGTVPPALGVPVLTRKTPVVQRRALFQTLAVLGVVAPTAWMGWRHAPWQSWAADYATATGERRHLDLPDGSRLALNTASAVDLDWSPRQRLVRLHRGEILVQTAPDPLQRPFLVVTPQGQLRALGTRFTVRLHGAAKDGSASTALQVLEHRVEVTPAAGSAPPQIVSAGQGLRFTASTFGPLQPSPDEASLAAGEPGWAQGVLYADGMRLDDFLAELARYRPGALRCAPEVAGLRISGAYQLADTDQVLRMLAATLPVALIQRTRWWVMVGPLQA